MKDVDNLGISASITPFDIGLTIGLQMSQFPSKKKIVYCSNCIIASLIVVNKFPNSPIITAALSGPRRQASMTKVR